MTSLIALSTSDRVIAQPWPVFCSPWIRNIPKRTCVYSKLAPASSSLPQSS